MTEMLHLSALLPAALGVCCTVGGRRGSRVLSGFEAIAALVMLTAMADVALGLNLVTPILWVAGLVVLALVGLPLGRVFRAGGNLSASPPVGFPQTVSPAPLLPRGSALAALRVPPSDGPARTATHAPLLHSSLGLIVMAGLLALMAAGHVAFVSGHHNGGGLLPVLVLGGSAI